MASTTLPRYISFDASKNRWRVMRVYKGQKFRSYHKTYEAAAARLREIELLIQDDGQSIDILNEILRG